MSEAVVFVTLTRLTCVGINEALGKFLNVNRAPGKVGVGPDTLANTTA